VKAARLRAIPSVDKVLQSLGDIGLPAPIVVDPCGDTFRRCGRRKRSPSLTRSSRTSVPRLERLRASRITPVINATGVLVHTNLGRAPLAADSIRALTSIGANYNTL
jgi:L-seryl-tRNA(Ser) seleniumtransferase